MTFPILDKTNAGDIRGFLKSVKRRKGIHMSSKISRRVFLKGCGGVALFSLMKPATGEASCLPAGISGCRDENLRYAWYFIQKGDLEKSGRYLEKGLTARANEAAGASINVEPAYVITMA